MRGLKGLPDGGAVRFGEGGFVVRGVFAFQSGVEKECLIEYTPEAGKRCVVDRSLIPRRADLIGFFPLVAMSGDDYRITRGGPGERRRFLDVFMCQASARYTEDLRRYTATLRQRNALLRSQVDSADGQFSVWTEQLVEYGTRIMAARSDLVSSIGRLLDPYFTVIAGKGRSVTVEYMPSVRETAGEVTREAFQRRLRSTAARERQFGVTLVGPHREDMAIRIDGHDLRQFGSRGDHKAVLISLRLAEHTLMRTLRGEPPILLLDDLLVDLDQKRSASIAGLFPTDAQVIFTTTAPDAWRIMGLAPDSFRLFTIKNGQITQVSA
jgi:DNA replication and repair protein RecF